MFETLLTSYIISVVLSQNNGKFIWNTVMIGGGGELEGLHFTTNGNLYARTDVGGFYKYLWEEEYWLNLVDWIPAVNSSYFSTDSFTSSPHEPEILYYTGGNGQPADIFKSTDNGTTWSHTNIANGQLVGGGNQNDRWGGYRIIVHPNPAQKDTVFFGSRQQGLWRTDKAGEPGSWYKVTTFPNLDFQNATSKVGIVYVNINPFNYYIYASVVNYGIYQSKDDGKTWTKITTGGYNLTNSLRSVFNPAVNDGLFYAADVKLGIFVFDEKTAKWGSIPPKDGTDTYHAMDISPDGKWMILAEHVYGQANLYYAPYAGSINQADWGWVILKGNNYDNRENDVPWMTPDMFASSPSAFIFNLNDYKKDPTKLSVIMSTIVVWFNKDILNTSTDSLWYTKTHGIEEVCLCDLACPPEGVSLITGIGDVEGFLHTNIKEYPSQRFYEADNPAEGALDTSSVDFCESNPNIIVRTPGNAYWDQTLPTNATISKDGGKTWTDLPGHPPHVNNHRAIAGQLRIAPDNCDHMVWVPLENYPQVTKDGGKTWTNSTGAPTWITGYMYEWEGANWHQFANDRKNGNYWYAMAGPWECQIYVSSDGGYTWKTKGCPIGYWNGVQPLIKTDWGTEGRVCAALGLTGLFCSDDYAETWTRLKSVNKSRLVGWGRSKDDASKSIMYYYGLSQEDRDNGMIVEAPYQVDESGNHLRMNTNSSYLLGCIPHLLRGDRQIYGRVYIGSEGRGVYYSDFVQS